MVLEVTSTPSLNDALDIVSGTNGILVFDHTVLSLPLTARRQVGGGWALEGHLPRTRIEVHTAVNQGTRARCLFRYGEHYIDPYWIRRAPHAPTETKLVCEMRGSLRSLPYDQHQALEALDRLRSEQQKFWRVTSPFRTDQLESGYLSTLLPKLFFFALDVEGFAVHQFMALQDLDPQSKERVMRHLESRGSEQALQAIRLLQYQPAALL